MSKTILLGLFAISPLIEIGIVNINEYPSAPSFLTQNLAQAAEKKRARRVPRISERFFQGLSEAQDLIDRKKYDAALEVLVDMEQRSRRYNGNEMGQLYAMFAFIMFSKEDNAGTIHYYEKVLEQGDDITVGLEHGTMYSLAQLYFVEGEHQRSLDMMEIWLQKKEEFGDDPGPNPRYFMGQVYYAMKDYPGATEQMELAISMAEARDMLPIKETWWQLLRFLHWEQENLGRVLEILHVLIRDHPHRDYWSQLANVNFDRETASTNQKAYLAGPLEVTDLRNYDGDLMRAEGDACTRCHELPPEEKEWLVLRPPDIQGDELIETVGRVCRLFNGAADFEAQRRFITLFVKKAWSNGPPDLDSPDISHEDVGQHFASVINASKINIKWDSERANSATISGVTRGPNPVGSMLDGACEQWLLLKLEDYLL